MIVLPLSSNCRQGADSNARHNSLKHLLIQRRIVEDEIHLAVFLMKPILFARQVTLISKGFDLALSHRSLPSNLAHFWSSWAHQIRQCWIPALYSDVIAITASWTMTSQCDTGAYVLWLTHVSWFMVLLFHFLCQCHYWSCFPYSVTLNHTDLPLNSA